MALCFIFSVDYCPAEANSSFGQEKAKKNRDENRGFLVSPGQN
jgi:hypothetical protein